MAKARYLLCQQGWVQHSYISERHTVCDITSHKVYTMWKDTWRQLRLGIREWDERKKCIQDIMLGKSALRWQSFSSRDMVCFKCCLRPLHVFPPVPQKLSVSVCMCVPHRVNKVSVCRYAWKEGIQIWLRDCLFMSMKLHGCECVSPHRQQA